MKTEINCQFASPINSADAAKYVRLERGGGYGYAAVFGNYSGEVIFVGINYDKDKKKTEHSCKIERLNVGDVEELSGFRRGRLWEFI